MLDGSGTVRTAGGGSDSKAPLASAVKFEMKEVVPDSVKSGLMPVKLSAASSRTAVLKSRKS